MSHAPLVCVILWYVFKLDELVPSCVQLLCLCTVPSVLFKVGMEEERKKDGFLWMFTTCTWKNVLCCILSRQSSQSLWEMQWVSLFNGQINSIFHFFLLRETDICFVWLYCDTLVFREGCNVIFVGTHTSALFVLLPSVFPRHDPIFERAMVLNSAVCFFRTSTKIEWKVLEYSALGIRLGE